VSVTISPQLRLLVVIGFLVALAGATSLMLMGRSTGSDAAPKVIKPLHPVAKHAAKAPTAAKKHATARPAVHKAVVVARPKPVHAVRPTPRSVVKARAPKAPLVTVKGLPAVLVRALSAHPVVIVALYQVDRTATPAERLAARAGRTADAAVGIDRLALAEAEQGARDAHAGFVGINVFRQAEAAPLTKLLGVLQDPAVLVFKRPGTVFVQLNGFADKDTVAQAAANAALQQ
jgi:hypothetical protein